MDWRIIIDPEGRGNGFDTGKVSDYIQSRREGWEHVLAALGYGFDKPKQENPKEETGGANDD